MRCHHHQLLADLAYWEGDGYRSTTVRCRNRPDWYVELGIPGAEELPGTDGITAARLCDEHHATVRGLSGWRSSERSGVAA